jgi:3-oxoacyl-[acyl-carrier protein] reductase
VHPVESAKPSPVSCTAAARPSAFTAPASSGSRRWPPIWATGFTCSLPIFLIATRSPRLGKSAEEKLEGVDILVNNAGITKDGLFVRMSDDAWDQVLEVNLTAVFRLTRELAHPMMKRRNGRIINITSVVGVSGNPGQANYCAAKAGMIGFSKSLAQEIAPRNVTVNCVAPGFIESAMTEKLNDKQKDAIMGAIPMRRMGTGAEIASAVTWLASDEASYVTGQTIHVNGGMLMV